MHKTDDVISDLFVYHFLQAAAVMRRDVTWQ